MHEIINQYFDLSQMSKHFDEVLDGFVITLELFAVAALLALVWGLILALLRQLPGKGLLPVRVLTISYIDVFRGVPLLILILLISGSLAFLPLPEAITHPALARQTRQLLVRDHGADARLRRLHGRGLPGRDRSRPARPDGSRPIARDEPLPGDAQRDRPAGVSARSRRRC